MPSNGGVSGTEKLTMPGPSKGLTMCTTGLLFYCARPASAAQQRCLRGDGSARADSGEQHKRAGKKTKTQNSKYCNLNAILAVYFFVYICPGLLLRGRRGLPLLGCTQRGIETNGARKAPVLRGFPAGLSELPIHRAAFIGASRHLQRREAGPARLVICAAQAGENRI